MVAITMISQFTGNEHTMELPLSDVEFNIALHAWRVEKKLIQHAFPTLTPAQREFLMTGTTQEEWDAEFAEDEE